MLAQKGEIQSMSDELQTVQTEVKSSHTRIADLTLKTQGTCSRPSTLMYPVCCYISLLDIGSAWSLQNPSQCIVKTKGECTARWKLLLLQPVMQGLPMCCLLKVFSHRPADTDTDGSNSLVRFDCLLNHHLLINYSFIKKHQLLGILNLPG